MSKEARMFSGPLLGCQDYGRDGNGSGQGRGVWTTSRISTSSPRCR